MCPTYTHDFATRGRLRRDSLLVACGEMVDSFIDILTVGDKSLDERCFLQYTPLMCHRTILSPFAEYRCRQNLSRLPLSRRGSFTGDSKCDTSGDHIMDVSILYLAVASQ